MKNDKRSIIKQEPFTCLLCEWEGKYRIYHQDELECHHVFGGAARRPISDKEGLTVNLCRKHHMEVHRVKEIRRRLQAYAQKIWELKEGHDREGWMKLMNRNYREI